MLLAELHSAHFEGADLKNANLEEAKLRGAKFDGESKLCGVSLSGADLSHAEWRGADLSGSKLERAVLVGTDLTGTHLSGSRVYGIAAWDVKLDDNTELRRDLVITPEDQSPVVVDELEVAQFTYLLLNNPNIRRVIDTIVRRGVLLLGRFSPERKAVLNALRAALREEGFVPQLFDFDRPAGRDFTETIITLAGMSRFVIADVTNPRSSPLELKATIPAFDIPFVPIIQKGEEPFSMFQDLVGKHGEKRGGPLITLRRYASVAALLEQLRPKIIEPAIALSDKLASLKGHPVESIDIE